MTRIITLSAALVMAADALTPPRNREEADALEALKALEAPNEWLAVVTDEDGNRIDSELFGGDYSEEQVRENAMRHFGDLPAGHNLRFHPIGPERVDMARGFAGDLPDPRLTKSIALLRARAGLQDQIDHANAMGNTALADAINDLHQANESKIDTDQTQYLLDRGWGDYDGWGRCPDPYIGETLWSGSATEEELLKWFGGARGRA